MLQTDIDGKHLQHVKQQNKARCGRLGGIYSQRPAQGNYVVQCYCLCGHTTISWSFDKFWFVFNSECIIIFFLLHIQDIGEKVYTVPKVVNEIKDKATLQRLQFLPYQLTPKSPSPESIRIGMIYVFKISSSLVSATLVEVKNLDWCKVKAHKVIQEVLPKIRAHIAFKLTTELPQLPYQYHLFTYNVI